MEGKKTNVLLLIDANALIHRFYHALPPLTTPEGKPIQAIYGLAGLILKILRDPSTGSGQGKPDYIAAAFDRPEKTFREEKFKEYKIHRPPAAAELVSQIIKAHELLDYFQIPILEAPGFEADDIIGTVAEKFKDSPDLEGGQIVILSGDLDVLQVVAGQKVVAQIIKTGMTNTVLYDEAAVIQRYGLKPAQMADYKGLVGDVSDNIPGVKGVGPKTAAELLRDFKTVEEIFDSITVIPPKIAKKLAGQEGIAKLSKELATIKRDVPLEIKLLSDLATKPLDKERLAKYFSGLGFKTLVERLIAIP